MPPLLPVKIVLISGSLRSGSISGAVVNTAAALVPEGTTAVVYAGLGVLPHLNPDEDRDPLPPSVAALRAELASADAVMLSTPEYAGSMPGSLKNLLDWTVGGGSLYRLPVGWINPSAHGGAIDTYQHLRLVLERAGAEIIESACASVPVPRDAVNSDGMIASAEARAGIAEAMAVLSAAARDRRKAD